MFWNDVNDGPGFSLESLTSAEHTRLNRLITDHYLENMKELAPQLVNEASELGIENYHQLAIPFDHAQTWSKNRRVLPETSIPKIEEFGFFQRIRQALPSARVIPQDLMWRLVRPQQPTDVGPVHADKWFWDAGNGIMPPGYDRLKVWIGVHTEAGANGLCVKSHSHKVDHWKRHFEFRHDKMKPVLDETVEELNMELLPLKSGELVLFHDSLLHGGVVNSGKRCRVSIEITVIYDIEEGNRLLESSRRRAA